MYITTQNLPGYLNLPNEFFNKTKVITVVIVIFYRFVERYFRRNTYAALQ
jgi:hypothetical protein